MKRLLVLLLVAVNVHAQDLTRFEDEIIAYDALSVPPDAMIVTGNSNIRLWKTLPADLSPLPAVNRGFGGSTAEELDYYLQRLVLRHHPASVVIHTGENETWSGRAPQVVSDNHKKIIQRLIAERADVRVYVIGLKPSPLRWSAWGKFQQVNALLKPMCEAIAQCTYIPPPNLLGADGKPKAEYYANDQLHLSSAGYKVWTADIRPYLIDGETQRRPKPPGELQAPL